MAFHARRVVLGCGLFPDFADGGVWFVAIHARGLRETGALQSVTELDGVPCRHSGTVLGTLAGVAPGANGVERPGCPPKTDVLFLFLVGIFDVKMGAVGKKCLPFYSSRLAQKSETFLVYSKCT